MRALSSLLFGMLCIPTAALAQQSLFNVPSATVTDAGEVFVQEQINFSERGTSNLTVDAGLWPGLEIGINVFDVTLYDTLEVLTEAPLAMINVVYTLKGERVNLQFGAQSGIAGGSRRQAVDAAEFGWMSARLRGEQYGDYVLGAYVASDAYVASGHNVGFMLGAEIPIVHEQLHFLLDFMYGDNELSVGVGGLVVMLPLGFQISIGAQFPSPGSENAWGAVLELTRIPSNAE